jgi:hypothetical protein
MTRSVSTRIIARAKAEFESFGGFAALRRYV